ncbi:MAG: hypothetical protein DMG23_08905 [Acidobacteria bacterium]|nr:MAG: hypothetical protein DMG23_08905 [Acidobacteriota bacterium]
MAEERYVFTASRWTSGNLIFPVHIEITPQRVSRIKTRLLGSDEESMAMSNVASISISTGLIWSQIRIESSGGTDPIVSHGHRKADARRIRDLIEQFQQRK